MDKMTKHNNMVLEQINKKKADYALKGCFLCGKVNSSGLMCMCNFSTESGWRKHQVTGKHKFSTPDLESWLHELHTGGRFAFSLATGECVHVFVIILSLMMLLS